MEKQEIQNQETTPKDTRETIKKTTDEIMRQLPEHVRDAVSAMRKTNRVRKANQRQKTFIRYERVGSVE